MKKNKKIPNTPKYKFGGFPKLEKGLKDYGLGLADQSLGMLGASNVIKDSQYSDTGFGNFMKKGSAITGEIGKVALPIAANIIAPGSGKFVSMGQQAIGQFNPQDPSQYDEQGNPINPNMQTAKQAIGMAGQIGGMAGMAFGKYGGQMKYAMGGMNKYPGGGMGEGNGQVELDENSIAPNGQFTQFNEPSHDAQNSNQPNASLAPGEKIFSAKLKPMGSKKSFADLNKSNNTNREDKLFSKGNLDPKSEVSLKLTMMAKMKNSDVLFNMQEQLKKDKVAAYAKKMGVQLPSMDNEQMEPQGMSEQSEGEVATARYGGMYAKGGIHINPANKGKFTASAQRAGMGVQEFANHVLANKEDYSSTQVKRANFAHNAAGWKHEMGGVQLPYYNTDNAGNPIYANGGKTPKSQERLNQEKFVNDYYDELSQNQFASMANLQGKRSGPDIWTPSMQIINSFRSNPNLDKLSDEKYAELTNQALSGVGFLRKKYEPYLHEDFTDVPKKYAMGGGYPAMTNPYHNFKGSIPMYQDGGNMPVNRPLKLSEVSSYGKTGYDNANMKNKDEKFELYNNPDYLIQNPNINTGKWNDFQSFLGTYKLPTGENFVGNKAGNTKLANEYTNLALSDYNKSLSEKYKNNPDVIKRKSVGLGDIEEVQKYYNQGNPNVPVDRILGSKTTQFRYPHFSSVSQYKAKPGEFVPVTYGGKEYVVDAETYNNKIVPVSEGKSDENVTKYFQSYDPRKHQNLDEKNAEIVNRLGTMQGGSGSFTKKGLGKLPPFIYRVGQGTQEEQWKNYQKENNLSFKYGGQMPIPKFWNGGRFGKKDPNETSYYNEEGVSQEEIDRMNNLPNNSSQSSWLTPKMMQESSDLMTEEDYPQLNNVLANNNQNSLLNSTPRLNFSKYGINSGKFNLKQPSNEDLRRQTFGTSSGSETLPGLDPKNKPNWMDIVGKGVNFAAQNMGNIYNLSRYDKPEEEKYERATAKYMDPTKAIAGENYIGRQTKAAIPGLVGGSGGAAMALLGANKANTATRIGRLRETYDNANAQIGNQVNQYNTGLAQQEVIANAANRARYRSGKGEAISQIGKNYNQMALDTKKGKMDQSMMEMMPKLINNPEFQKFYTEWMKNNAGSSVA